MPGQHVQRSEQRDGAVPAVMRSTNDVGELVLPLSTLSCVHDRLVQPSPDLMREPLSTLINALPHVPVRFQAWEGQGRIVTGLS